MTWFGLLLMVGTAVAVFLLVRYIGMRLIDGYEIARSNDL